MPQFKNIIFDLGGVLLDIDFNLSRQAFEALGVKDFDDMYSQANADELFQNLERGTIEVPEFYRKLNECTGLDLSPKEINEAWNALLLDFREDSLAYLEELKPRARLILLSNTNIIHRDAFRNIFHQKPRAHSFEDYFHHCIYSFETGTRKPDKSCYEWVIQQTGIRPQESLFIDDSKQNIEAAEQMNIHSILLEKGMTVENLELERMLAAKH